MSYQQPYGYPVQTQVLVQPYRCSTAHVVIAWVVTVLTGLYMLPWAIAATRNRRNVAAIAMIDLFLGWSLIGWVVALIMACGSDQPAVLVQHTYAQQAPYPAQQPYPVQQQPYPAQQPWQPPQQWVQAPRPPAPPTAPALPAGPAWPVQPDEPTTVDPFGSEPTQQLPHSPWEPDHRR